MEIVRVLLRDVLESVHLAVSVRMHDFSLHPIDLVEQRFGSAISPSKPHTDAMRYRDPRAILPPTYAACLPHDVACRRNFEALEVPMLKLVGLRLTSWCWAIAHRRRYAASSRRCSARSSRKRAWRPRHTACGSGGAPPFARAGRLSVARGALLQPGVSHRPFTCGRSCPARRYAVPRRGRPWARSRRSRKCHSGSTGRGCRRSPLQQPRRQAPTRWSSTRRTAALGRRLPRAGPRGCTKLDVNQ